MYAVNRPAGKLTIIISSASYGPVHHLAVGWSSYMGTLTACGIHVKQDDNFYHVWPRDELAEKLTCKRCLNTRTVKKAVA